MLRAEGGRKVPADYEQQIIRAELTFCHQRIFDLTYRRVTSLTPLPHDESSEEWSFLGPLVAEDVAKLIAAGRICPISRVQFLEPVFVEKENKKDKSQEIFTEQKKHRTSIKYKEEIQSTLNRIKLDRSTLTAGNLPPYHFINEAKPRSLSSLLSGKKTTSIRQQIMLPSGQKSIKDFFIPKLNKS